MGVTRFSMSQEAAAPTAMQNRISQRLRQATCNRFVSRCFFGWSMADEPGWGTVSAYGSTSTKDDITFSTRNAEGQSYGKEVRTNRSRRILIDGYDTVLSSYHAKVPARRAGARNGDNIQCIRTHYGVQIKWTDVNSVKPILPFIPTMTIWPFIDSIEQPKFLILTAATTILKVRTPIT